MEQIKPPFKKGNMLLAAASVALVTSCAAPQEVRLNHDDCEWPQPQDVQGHTTTTDDVKEFGVSAPGTMGERGVRVVLLHSLRQPDAVAFVDPGNNVKIGEMKVQPNSTSDGYPVFMTVWKEDTYFVLLERTPADKEEPDPEAIEYNILETKITEFDGDFSEVDIPGGSIAC